MLEVAPPLVSARLAGDRITRLPAPGTPPPGRLEQVGWVLLHRAGAFDPLAQAHLASLWELPVTPVLAQRAVSAAGDGQRRAPGVLRRIDMLAYECAPPPTLAYALSLVRQAPHLTREGVRRALLLAGLSDGQAGAALLRVLARAWRLKVAGTALEPDRARAGAAGRPGPASPASGRQVDA